MSLLTFAVVALVWITPAAPAASATFELTLERTPSGWSATCASGCAWTKVSMSCEYGCQAVLSHSGMATQRSEELANDPFAFVVERTARGWQASAVSGTAWTALSFGCAADGGDCVALITDVGVFPR